MTGEMLSCSILCIASTLLGHKMLIISSVSLQMEKCVLGVWKCFHNLRSYYMFYSCFSLYSTLHGFHPVYKDWDDKRACSPCWWKYKRKQKSLVHVNQYGCYSHVIENYEYNVMRIEILKYLCTAHVWNLKCNVFCQRWTHYKPFKRSIL